MLNLREYDGNVRDASGNKIPIIGEGIAKLITPAGCFKTPVLIYNKTVSVEHELLIGMNVLKHTTIDFKKREIQFSLENIAQTYNNTHNCIEITVPNTTINCTSSESKSALVHAERALEQAAPLGSMTLDPSRDGPREFPASPSKQETSSTLPAGKTTAGITLQAENIQEIPVFLRSDLTIGKNTLMLATVPVNKQIRNGTDIILPRKQLTENVVLASVVTRVTNNCITVNLVNVSNEQETLTPGTKLGPAEQLYANNIVGAQSESINIARTTEPRSKPPEKVKKSKERPLITSEDINCDDPRFSERVLHELNTYRDACWLPGEPLGKYSEDQLEIRLKEHNVVNKAPYRVPYAYQNKLDEYIKKLLDEGTITRSKSSFNSPLIIVKRGDGEIRPCIDYRKLNELMEPV